MGIQKFRMTRERVSFIFEPKDMNSLQTGFSFVKDAVACTVFERASGFKPSSETTAPRNLESEALYGTQLLSFCNLRWPTLIFF